MCESWLDPGHSLKKKNDPAVKRHRGNSSGPQMQIVCCYDFHHSVVVSWQDDLIRRCWYIWTGGIKMSAVCLQIVQQNKSIWREGGRRGGQYVNSCRISKSLYSLQIYRLGFSELEVLGRERWQSIQRRLSSSKQPDPRLLPPQRLDWLSEWQQPDPPFEVVLKGWKTSFRIPWSSSHPSL